MTDGLEAAAAIDGTPAAAAGGAAAPVAAVAPVAAPAPPCCGNADLVAIPADLPLSYQGGLPAPGAGPTTMCLGCCWTDAPNVALSVAAVARIRADAWLSRGVDVDAVASGFPRLQTLGERHPTLTIATKAQWRIDDRLDPIKADPAQLSGLRGRIANNLGVLRAETRWPWPRAIAVLGLDRLVYLHSGLAVKFTDVISPDGRCDPAHVRFVAYVPEVLANPIEIWESDDGNPPRRVYRIFGTVSVGPRVWVTYAIVEVENSIVSTVYTPVYPPAVEVKRKGRLVYAAWLRPPA